MSRQSHTIEPEELMAYLDGELPAERALETASHLEHCRECQKLADDFRRLSREVLEWQVEDTASQIQPGIVAALDEVRPEAPRSPSRGIRLRPRSSVKRVLLWTGGVAAAAVVLFMFATSNLLRSKYAAEQPAQLAPARMAAANAGRGDKVIDGNDGNETASFYLSGNSTRQRADSSSHYSYDAEGSLQPPPPPPPPSATPAPGTFAAKDRLASDDQQTDGVESDNNLESPSPGNGPMIVHTVDLALIARDFDQSRSSLDEILKRHHGYLGGLSVSTPTGSARSLTATLRIPSNRLETALADLKRLGRVEKEAQNGEEVTQQYVDLEARLKNARNTENRLIELQRQRTGKLSDVLAVEKEISRVRAEIEQMEAERKNLGNRIDFATLNLTVTEDYKAELKVVPPSIGTQMRNAAVDGYRSVVDGLLGLLLWLLSWLPTLFVWALVLFYPVRIAWRKLRPRFMQKTSEV